MKQLLWEAGYIYITPKNLHSKFGWGVVSTIWSASDTEFQNPKSQLWMGVVSDFLSASNTESQNPKSQLWMGGLSLPFDQQMTLRQKNLSPNFGWGLSLPFDQQVTLSPKNLTLCPKILSPNIRYGGVTTLAQNTFSFQQVSPPRQRHLVFMRCYLLTIQVGNERIAVRSLLYIHNSKNPNFKLWVGGCLCVFDQQVTLSPNT